MNEIDLASYDLNTPSGRQSVLKKISPTREEARKYHAVLLDIFRRETVFRRMDDETASKLTYADGDTDYFDNIYWCGFLLYFVGDPADVPLMWAAKQTDMDTAIGFDFQFLLGAGADATLEYLRDNGKKEIVDYLENWKQYPDFEPESLSRWEKSRTKYFYEPPEEAAHRIKPSTILDQSGR